MAEHQIQVTEVLDLTLSGVTFYCWIFLLFLRSKACDANFAVIANSG